MDDFLLIDRLISITLYIAYALVGVAVVAAVYLPLYTKALASFPNVRVLKIVYRVVGGIGTTVAYYLVARTARDTGIEPDRATVRIITIIVSTIVVPYLVAFIASPKDMLRSVISIVALILFFVVGYAASGDETLPYITAEVPVSAAISKLVGGSLYMMYALLWFSFAVLLGAFIRQLRSLKRIIALVAISAGQYVVITQTDLVNSSLILAYVGVIVAIASAILLPFITSLSTNPRGLVKSGLGVGVLLILFFIGWLVSGNETFPYLTAEVPVSASISKVIGGSLIMMYLMAIIVLVGILFTEFFKPRSNA